MEENVYRNKHHKAKPGLYAKAEGLKSIYKYGDKVAVVTFGDSKDPTIVEHAIDKLTKDKKFIDRKADQNVFQSTLENKSDTEKHIIKLFAKDSIFEDANFDVLVENRDVTGMDLMKFKPILERKIFGGEFNDNIHIQIAYNILDFKKVISFHAANAFKTINNVCRLYKETDENYYSDDLIGKIWPETSFNALSEKNRQEDKNLIFRLVKYNGYFDNVFKTFKKDCDGYADVNNQNFSYNYDILRCIGLVRQGCTHSGEHAHSLFNFQNDPKFEDVLRCSQDIFKIDLRSFNQSFVLKNRYHLQVLFELYKCEDKEFRTKLCEDYYNFKLYRDDKNLGFELKQIRERVYSESEKKNITEDLNFVNSLLDFYLFSYYKNNKEISEKLVSDLRKKPDDWNKNITYNLAYNDLRKNQKIASDFEQLKVLISKVEREKKELEKRRNVELSKLYDEKRTLKQEHANKEMLSKKDREISELRKKYEQIDLEYEDYFNFETIEKAVVLAPMVALLYVLCKFLDGKEINELLNSVSNKCRNIKELLIGAEKVGINITYLDEYKIFEHKSVNHLIASLKITKNLAPLKRQFAKQEKIRDKEFEKLINAKSEPSKQLIFDVINTFSERDFIDVFNPNDGIYKFYDEKLYGLGNKKGEKIRNFISSSVIKGKYFNYVIKYVEPVLINKLLKNEEVLNFVLGRTDEKRMPIKQLQKYYASINKDINGAENCEFRSTMIDFIISKIKTLSLDNIINFEDDKVNLKQDLTPIVRLYLTLAYRIVKNIVITNSIYFIAWSCFERDYFTRYESEIRNYKKDIQSITDYFRLTEEKVYMDNKTKSNKDLLNDNIKEAKKYLWVEPRDIVVDGKPKTISSIYRIYRNNIEHLNLCSIFANYIDGIKNIRSYFDIYQYALQKWFVTQENYFKDESYRNKLEQDLKTYGSYQKDFLKLINLPFGYCLARYKNLTIGDLFNDKYPLDKKVHEEYYGEENK